MKVQVDHLAADGFELELPDDKGGPADRFKIARGVGLKGAYIQEAREIHLSGITADELDASLALLHLSGGKRFSAAPLSLRGGEMDCRLARGPLEGRVKLGGKIAARELSGRTIEVALGVGGDGAARDLAIGSLEAGPLIWSNAVKEGMSVVAGGMKLGNGRLDLAGTTITFEAIAAKDVVVTVTDAGTRLAAAAIEARGVQVVVGKTRVRVDRVALTSGVVFDRGRLSIGGAAVGEIALDLELSPKRDDGAPKAAAPPLDFRFLDGLTGRVDVDVIVDAKVSVLHRKAKHKLRVQVDDGILDFHQLERNLSALEDAVLDFEFEGDRLILEKDIPLIPFDNETLVSWHLDAEGKRLAEDRRVRLRTLAKPEIPKQGTATKEPKKGGFELLKLDLDPIDVDLRLASAAPFALPNGAVLTLGDGLRAAIESVRVQGAVRHRADEAEAGRVEMGVTNLRAGIENLRLGGRTLSLKKVEIGSTQELSIGLIDFTPMAVRAVARDVHLGEVNLSAPAGET